MLITFRYTFYVQANSRNVIWISFSISEPIHDDPHHAYSSMSTINNADMGEFFILTVQDLFGLNGTSNTIDK